jgi:RNA polymerase sigma-70 factor (ECF subfamily)
MIHPADALSKHPGRSESKQKRPVRLAARSPPPDETEVRAKTGQGICRKSPSAAERPLTIAVSLVMVVGIPDSDGGSFPMPESSFNTVHLHACVDRMRAGDRNAADALLRRVCGRLRRLARSMLRGFPNVQRWADTDDVLQSTLMRLLRTLQNIRPQSTRDFVNLAALHIRRELLDLARHCRGRREHTGAAGGSDVLAQAPDRNGAEKDLELWTSFHEEAEKLPTEEHEVFGLAFYHGWTQAQIAELLQVDERTVRRRWRAASQKLYDALGGRLPEA